MGGVERLLPAAAPHAIVIGSGFGGLAAAVRLSCKGYRVTVLEKLDRPGGRAGVWQQDGFTFDAGPTIVTAPFMLEELWALCGRRLADDVDAGADRTRSIASASTTARTSTTATTPRPCAQQIRRISPADVAGYERFVAEAELCLSAGLREARRHRLRPHRRPAARQPEPDAHARLAQPVCDGGRAHEAPEAAHRLQPAVAADRRQPLQRHQHLQPDQRAGAALRRALGDGRHRRAGARPGGAAGAARRAGALQHRGQAHHGRARPRHRRASWPTASASPPTSWSAMPTPPGPTGTWSRPSTGRTGPTSASRARSIR